MEKQNKSNTSNTYLFYDVEIRKVEYQWQEPRQSHEREWRLDGVHSHSETKHAYNGLSASSYAYLWRK